MTPYARGAAPIEASYLTAVFDNDAPRQSMQLARHRPLEDHVPQL